MFRKRRNIVRQEGSIIRIDGRKLRKGFTLLELLVVVVVISVLMAILIPALGKAKQTAGRAACGEQLKGIATGIRSYLNDNDDVMPMGAQMPSIAAQDSLPGPPNPPALPVTMKNEISAPNAWRCPGDNIGYVPSSLSALYGQTFPSYFAGETLSYEYNQGLSGVKMTRYFLYAKLGDTGTFVLADFDAFHGQKGSVQAKNILFSDSHVGDINDIFDAAGAPTINP